MTCRTSGYLQSWQNEDGLATRDSQLFGGTLLSVLMVNPETGPLFPGLLVATICDFFGDAKASARVAFGALCLPLSKSQERPSINGECITRSSFQMIRRCLPLLMEFVSLEASFTSFRPSQCACRSGSTYDVHVDGLDLAVPVYDSRRFEGRIQ